MKMSNNKCDNTDNDEKYTSIVIDNGTGLLKAGFATRDTPQVVIPNVTGLERITMGMYAIDYREIFIGQDAIERQGLTIKHPIEHGIVCNWNDMEKIWHYTFYKQLNIASIESHPVLLTQVPMNPKANTERMTQIMFEIFAVPALYINVEAVLSLYATNQTTGCVIDSGYGITHIVPIHEGYIISNAITRLDLSGNDVTEYLTKLLCQRGYDLTTTKEVGYVNDMKESSLCYVALDYQDELTKVIENPTAFTKSYTLPDDKYTNDDDDNVITFDKERFQCTEILFQPSLIGFDDDDNDLEVDGIAKSTFRTISKCNHDIQQDLFGHIVLAGGNTMFPGITERLSKDIASLLLLQQQQQGGAESATPKIKIQAPVGRNYSAWIGGSMLATLDAFQEMWITKEEYSEYGSSIVHYKCTC